MIKKEAFLVLFINCCLLFATFNVISDEKEILLNTEPFPEGPYIFATPPPINVFDILKQHKVLKKKLIRENENIKVYLIKIEKEVKKHSHQAATEIVYIIEGKGVFYLEDKEYKIKPGDIIYIPKGKLHGCKKVDKKPIIAISVIVE